MIDPGTVALCEFPFADSPQMKFRPCLVLTPVPGEHDDYLVCMITTNVSRAIDGVDLMVSSGDDDFILSGLKKTSVLRICRITILNSGLLKGRIGNISIERLALIRTRLADWITGKSKC